MLHKCFMFDGVVAGLILAQHWVNVSCSTACTIEITGEKCIEGRHNYYIATLGIKGVLDSGLGNDGNNRLSLSGLGACGNTIRPLCLISQF